MSIHRRFNQWGHYRIGDAAAVTPDPAQTNAVGEPKRDNFAIGLMMGLTVGAVFEEWNKKR